MPGEGEAARFFDSFRLDAGASAPDTPAGPVAKGPAPPPAGNPPGSKPARKPPAKPRADPSAPPGARPVWQENDGDRTVAFAFSPDGATLAVGHWDKKLRLWDVAGSADRQLIPVDIGVTTVAFSKDGSRLAVGSGNGHVMLWDPAAPKELKRFQVLHTREKDQTQVKALAFAPDGRSLAVAVVPGNSNS